MRRLLAMALVDKRQVALADSTLQEVSAFQQTWLSVTQFEILVLDRAFEAAINAWALHLELVPVCKQVDSFDAFNT